MQRRGIVLLAELPFDNTVVRECPGLRVAQCLPGPGQDAGVGALPIAQALHLKSVFAALARQVADDECGHLKYLQKV
jgi:hypothetical protein